MPDNLTLRFKEELSKRGIVATDSQIESFLATQRAAPSQPPINLGGSLYENTSPSGGVGLSDFFAGGQQQPVEQDPEYMRNLYESAGIGLWNYFDIATFTIPSAVLGVAGIDPIEEYKKAFGVEELTPAGKVGEVVGQAAGFLKPIKWVTKGTSAIVSRFAAKGGKRVIGNVVDDAAKVATEKGLSSNVFRSSLEAEFKTKKTSEFLAKYSLKL